MVLFAFTTLIGNLFYVDKAVLHLMGKEPSKKFKTIYYIVFSLLIFLGAGLNAGLLWDISDIFMGCMAIINVPVIIILGKYSIRALNDYIKQKKAGKTPTFLASSIGLTDKVDYWQEQP